MLENLFQQDEDAANGLTNILFLLVRYQGIQNSILDAEFEDARCLYYGLKELNTELEANVLKPTWNYSPAAVKHQDQACQRLYPSLHVSDSICPPIRQGQSPPCSQKHRERRWVEADVV